MRGQPITFSDLGGGLNSTAAPYGLADSEARDLLNVQFTTRGSVKKRDGSTTLATPGSAVTGVFASEVTSTGLLLVQSGTSLWTVERNGTVTALPALPSGGRWEWTQAPTSGGQGPVYGSNGTDVRFYDGATTGTWTASTGTLRPCKFIAYAGGRVFMANDPNAKSRVYASNIGNPRDWPAATLADFDASDGQAITGLATVGPYVVVAKDRKIFVIYDLDTLANRRISDGVGCAANRSMVETPRGLFFLSLDQGVQVTDGSTVKRVSENVSPTIDAVQTSLRAEAAGAFFNNRYFLSFSTAGSVNNRTLELDLQTNAWTLHDLAGQQWAPWRPFDAQQLYVGKGNGVVARAFVPGVSADSGAAMDSFWKSAFWTFKRPDIRKRVRGIRFDGAGQVQLSVARDFALGEELVQTVNFDASTDTLGGSGTLGGGGTLGGPGSVQRSRVPGLGVARAWSLKFSSNTTAAWEVDSATVALGPRKD